MKLQQNKTKVVVVVVLLVGMLAWLLSDTSPSQYHLKLKKWYTELVAFGKGTGSDKLALAKQLSIDETGNDDGCHGKLPEHGKQYLFSSKQQNLKQKSRLFVNNAHVYPIWVTLYNADSLDPASSFYVKAGKHSKFEMPVGRYEVDVESGSVWCNQAVGFEDAALLESDALVNIVPNEVEYINISSDGSMPSDMVYLDESMTNNNERQIHGQGNLVLQKVVGGHYAVEGSINLKPTFFLVDTGATDISIPYNFAVHAGVKGCEKMKVTTASGVSDACRGLADEVVVGQYIFKNVEVVYKKSMPEDTFLLGMSILSQFEMVQKDGQMVLSRN